MMLKKLQAFPKKKKKNLDTDFTSITKGDSKWIIDLTVNWNTIKFLEGSIGENLDALQMMMLFRYNKDTIHKKIIDKLDFIKIKSFSSMKDTVKRMRRKTMEWEKIFAKDTSDFPKIYK